MTKEYDGLDLVTALAGTVGALGVAARYAVGGVLVTSRRLRRLGSGAGYQAGVEARRMARRAIGAVDVLRGAPPPPRRRGLELTVVGVAGAVLGAVAVVELWRVGGGYATGGKEPAAKEPAPRTPESAGTPGR